MTTIEALEILKNNQCACGSGKQFRAAFCRSCYYKLPTAIRRALYAKLGSGFEQAYDLALDTLGLKTQEVSLGERLEFAERHGE